MPWYTQVYTLWLVVVAALGMGMALMVLRRRPAPGARSFAILLGLVGMYALAVALGAAGSSFQAKVWWARVEYLPLVAAPVAWVAFARRHAQTTPLSRRQLAAMLVVPVLTTLVLWTNPLHGLFWQTMTLEERGAATELAVSHGPWFWVNLTYSYALIALGAFYITQGIRFQAARRRRQTVLLLLACAIPWACSLLYMALPTARELTLMVSSLLWIAVVVRITLRLRLFDVLPVARETVLTQMRDGVIVLDHAERVVDVNPAAQRLLGLAETAVIGQPVRALLPQIAQCLPVAPSADDCEGEITLGEGAAARQLHMQLSFLGDELGAPSGGLLTVRDVTADREARDALERRAAELAALQSTVLDITAARNLPSLLEAIVERAAELIGAPGGGMYLCEPAEQQVRCVVSYNTPSDYVGTVLRFGEGASGRVATTGEPLVIDDYALWEGRAAAYEQDQPFGAVVCVPMVWRGDVRGVLVVLDSRARRFTDEDCGLLQLFASHAAIALENSRLIDALQRELLDRQSLERRIENRRLHLERVLAATPDAIIAVDHQHRVTEWNPGAQRLFGYTADEALGRDLDDLVTGDQEDTRAEALTLTRRVLAGRPVPPTEVVRYRKDRTPLDVVAAGSPILVDGDLIGVVAVYTDITELRQIEQALRQSEARYRSLFEDSPISLWQEDWSRVKAHVDSLREQGVTDFPAYFEAHPEEIAAFGKRVVIRDVNKATLQMYNASSKRKLIAGLENIFVPESAAAVREDLLAIAQGNTSYEHEVVNKTLSGERKIMQVRVRVLPGAESTWNQVAVSVVDITDQQAAEQALAQSLRQKETLLREVHHRVKNNLQVVSSLLYLQALRAEPLGASDILHDSRNQVQSMALVHEKLYGSEDLAQVDLRDYLQSLVTSLLQFHHNASEYIQVLVEVPDERLDVDRAMPCGLIVNELVSNALKHAFPGGRSGQLLVRVNREGPLCQVLVQDDGVGLPGDLQPDDPTKLGLQLVRMLVEQLHGTLEVCSVDGAQFRITFPAWQSAPGEDDAP